MFFRVSIPLTRFAGKWVSSVSLGWKVPFKPMYWAGHTERLGLEAANYGWTGPRVCKTRKRALGTFWMAVEHFGTKVSKHC